MRAISAAVEVSSAIGAIARRAIAMPASSASAVPPSTPTSSRNSSTRATVASVSEIARPVLDDRRCPIGDAARRRRTSRARLTTR